MRRLLCIAAWLLFLHTGHAVAAGPEIPLGLPDEAILSGLGPLSCRADLPDQSPIKTKPCSRAELLNHGMIQHSIAAALTALAECRAGDSDCWRRVMISIFTRRAVASSPGDEVTLEQIVSQPKQYAGWSRGRLNPASIALHILPAVQMAAAFAAGDYDRDPLRYTHYARCDANPSWMQAARRAGIKIVQTEDGHCWITGTADDPALILWPRPAGSRKGVSWLKVRDHAPAMFAAIYGPRTAAGLAMR